ncbi:MAG: hypothetical protein II475_01315 [Bacteroidales bacterium]|nr:hypothetical protein [Bacteroidales bacterium]MBQ3941845.1 hypothetical protein [Bacteroidales bacterium]
MIKKAFSGAYLTPVCEIAEKLIEGLICESQDAVIEDFEDGGEFNW